jgi:Sigma-70 region 2
LLAFFDFYLVEIRHLGMTGLNASQPALHFEAIFQLTFRDPLLQTTQSFFDLLYEAATYSFLFLLPSRRATQNVSLFPPGMGMCFTSTSDRIFSKSFRELGGRSNWNEAQENAARRLIESQLALVVSIAKKHSASDVPILELIEEGNVGLMNAVRSFAEKPTGDFSAHAATCIEDAITKALSKSK